MRVRSVLVGVIAGLLLPAMAPAYTSVFRSAYTELSDSFAAGIATGDYDGDGVLDAAMCSGGSSNRLVVFYGFDDGTVQQGNDVPLGSIPTGMTQADFDADGTPDLVIAKGSEDAIVFLKGLANSDYFESPGLPIAVGENPAGLATADIDGDGIVDVVVANDGGEGAQGSVTILHGNGDGTFTRLPQPNPADPGGTVDNLPAGLGTRAVAIGNIDADPALDILALNSRSNSISVFSGDGNGAFTAHGTLPSGPGASDLALAEVNGDGMPDLVVATADADAITVALGKGDRTFQTASSYPVGTAPKRLAVADLDGDGQLDIVTSNSRSGDMSVLRGRTGGTFAAARTFVADAEPQVLALGDFNGDQLLDVITATQGSSSASVAVLRNRGAGVLHGVEDISVGGAPTDVAVADVDGDGTADAIVSGTNSKVLILPGGSTGFGAPRYLNAGGRALGVAAADLNGDRFPDIAVVDGDNGGVVVFLSNAYGKLASPVFYPTAPGPNRVTIGDFNGDRRPDIAVSTMGTNRKCAGGPDSGKSCVQDSECGAGGICSAPGKASVLLQQSNGKFGAAQNTDVQETPVGIAAIDANCDGKDDLLVSNLASDTVSVLRSQGNGSFTLAQTLGESLVGKTPMGLAVADFNRDGVPDFAVTDAVSEAQVPNVRLLRGACGGSFSAFPITGPALRVEQASAVVARDFTGDQIVDLAVSSQTGNEVALFIGKGDGTMKLKGADRVSRMPMAAGAGDFDGDGRYDAVSANSDPSANNVSVLNNCARDAGCDPIGNPGPTGSAALRGDGNNDGRRSAADLIAAAREIADGDGTQVEGISRGSYVASPGVDANGDGRVDPQDRVAIAHSIFGGA